jgi:outer membrane protein assembly factor BamA
MRAIVLAVLVGLLPGASAGAQDTRAGVIAAAQAAKAAAPEPPPPSRAEQVTEWVQDRLLTERSSSVFPVLDSVYGGGGVTLGAGYRRAFADRSFWTARGLYSVKGYSLAQVDVVNPDLARGRASLGATLGWRDATRVGYYGLGMDTTRGDRADFRFQQIFGGVTGTFRPQRWLHLQAAGGVEDYTLKDATGRRRDIDEVHTPASAPGLGDSPTFLRADLRAGLDTRPSPGYARTGSYLGAALVSYVDTGDRYGFNRVDLDAVHHVPLLRETWVLSFRARVQTTLDDDDVVPFYLMPALGGGGSLRGYSSRRFRDRHSLLLSGEWRWIPNRLGMDMAVFVDAGKVASRRADLDFSGLKHDVGIGLRFHAPAVTLVRAEVARGSEGWKLVVGSGAAF